MEVADGDDALLLLRDYGVRDGDEKCRERHRGDADNPL
jgi:hypothetical protein